jgi:hypothetical protein
MFIHSENDEKENLKFSTSTPQNGGKPLKEETKSQSLKVSITKR